MRAPAVGYRVRQMVPPFSTSPTLPAFPTPRGALGVAIYIGDGATVGGRWCARDDVSIGHAPIATQLGWCAANGVARAIFTHCGSGIVKSDTKRVEARIRQLGADHGVEASVAYDGLMMTLAAPKRGMVRAKATGD